MKTLIIYHQVKFGIDCPDGIAAAWVAKQKYPDSDVLGWVYQSEESPDVDGYDRLVIVDFSFPAKLLIEWNLLGLDVIVIDHHKTAMQNLEGLSNSVLQRFDMNECGATLAWKTFFPGETMPEFLRYVRDRDLWNHELVRTKEAHEMFSQLRYSITSSAKHECVFDVCSALARLEKREFIALAIAIGGPKVEERRRRVEKIAGRWQWLNVVEHKIPGVVLAADGSEDRLTSDICAHLYNTLVPSAKFVCCITSDESYSLRSNKHDPGGGFDVGTLAKTMGGGGHHNAAGFKSPELVLRNKEE